VRAEAVEEHVRERAARLEPEEPLRPVQASERAGAALDDLHVALRVTDVGAGDLDLDVLDLGHARQARHAPQERREGQLEQAVAVDELGIRERLAQETLALAHGQRQLVGAEARHLQHVVHE